jgi:hypothetical protein
LKGKIMAQLTTIIEGFLPDATAAAVAMAVIAITVGVIRMIRSKV